MAGKSFTSKPTSIINRENGNQVGPPELIYARSGSVERNIRSVRPKPLTGTDMIIFRQWRNANHYTNGRWTGSLGWAYAGFPVRFTDEKTTGDNYARPLNRMARANLAKGDVDLSETLLGLRQTARMIASAIEAIGVKLEPVATGRNLNSVLTRPLSRAESAAYRRASTPMQRLHAIHLGIIFGWKQLADDVVEGLNAHRNLVLAGDQIKAGVSGNPESHKGPVGDPPEGGLTSLDQLGPLASHGSARGTVSDPLVSTLNRLGLLNLPSAAWNQLPASWLVDWFLPIGDIAAGLTAGLGLTGCYTSIISEERSAIIKNIGQGREVLDSCNQRIWRTIYPFTAPFTPGLRKVTYSLTASQVLTAVSYARVRLRI